MLNSKIPIEYDKESKMDEYCDFVLNNAPKNKPFEVKNFMLNNLPNEEKNIVMDLFNAVQIRLIQMNKLEFIKSMGKCKLIDEQNNIVNNFNNNLSNSKIGVLNQSSNFSNSPQTNNITANNKADLKTKPIAKFWKLISENKLISSFIFVIILYIIKIYFGIEL